MRKLKGFTLIELLVVISIIAMLLAILMPSLQRVKKQAQAVVCRSNLKQFGVMSALYATDFDGKLTPGHGLIYENQGGLWPNEYGAYHEGTEEIRLCPSAKKGHPNPVLPSDYVGSTFEASCWGDWGDGFEYIETGDWFSLGMNNFACDAEEDPGVGPGLTSEGFEVNKYWKTSTAKGAYNIPLMGDCAWVLAGGNSDISQFMTPAEFNDVIPEHWGLELYAIDRHEGSIDMTFLDGSARSVGLKEVWTLSWHRGFDKRNVWTKAGGAVRDQWPEWMREFKEY